MTVSRQPYAKDEDPYWGLDLDLARRMAGLFTLVGALFSVILWPLSPLSDQIGNAGWAISAGLVAVGVVTAVLMLWNRPIWSYAGLAVVAFASVPSIAIGQWLAGGAGEPYENLILIPLLFVAAIYPVRILVAFLLLAGVSLGAPLLYDKSSGDVIANLLGTFLLLVGLGAAIHYLLLQIRTQRLALAKSEERARSEARVDELTVISNRRAFEEALPDEISRSSRMGTPLTMAMGDIEAFKRINDEFGHLEGDRCLHRVAQAMDSELRIPDRVFRWGGDEFALLLPGADKEGAEAVIERLQAKVSAACRRPDNEPIQIHFAAAELEPQMTAAEFAAAADLALMAARPHSLHARA